MSLCPGAATLPLRGACIIGLLVCSGRVEGLAQMRRTDFVNWRWITSQSAHRKVQLKPFTAMVIDEQAQASQRRGIKH